MEFTEDLLETQDGPYSGIDRILYLSCQQCSRYTPFIIYLSPNDNSTSSAKPITCCAECLSEDWTSQYPPDPDLLIHNQSFLQLIRGFEYSNPFYRRYAQMYRTLITADTRLEVNSPELENLSLFERLHKLQEMFDPIHLIPNKRYSGLVEMAEALVARNNCVRQFYHLRQQPPVEAVECAAASTSDYQFMECTTATLASTLCVSSPSAPVVSQAARLKILSSEEQHPCDICLLTEKNTTQFGPFIEKPFVRDVVRCHYFCLLSGTHIQQRGGDNSGVLGFLLSDVKQSMVLFRKKECYCCGQPSAPIKCNATGCERYFHYICGFRKGCLTQFIEQYHSYCHEHLPLDDDDEIRHHPKQKCWICWEELKEYKPVSSFHSVCEPDESAENPQIEYSWYHRDCLQKYAYEAGYYFKCPHCHEKKDFPSYARRRGIFVPMRDASWEIDRTYFKSLHGRSCSAEDCQYSDRKSRPQQMVGCKACGGETLHLKCAAIQDPSDYVCSKCMDATFIKLF